jgi:hypothetical protein
VSPGQTKQRTGNGFEQAWPRVRTHEWDYMTCSPELGKIEQCLPVGLMNGSVGQSDLLSPKPCSYDLIHPLGGVRTHL